MLAGTDLPSSSRALVTLATQTHDAHPHRPIQRVASFITQLMANAGRLPQAREKRRADPASDVLHHSLSRATVERLRSSTKSQEMKSLGY